MASSMPLVTLEEHYVDHQVLGTSQEDAFAYSAFPQPLMDKLASLGDDRLADLDANSISMQVLSHAPVDPSPHVCRGANDRLAATVRRNPTRYAAFALLPMVDPQAAAEELNRCVRDLGFVGALVSNHHKGSFYDDPRYWPVFSTAQGLDVPVYIHPAFPSQDKIYQYRGHYSEPIAQMLGAWGWGWHCDVGLHVLRLYAAGLFDLFPKLKIVIGHMGEMLPFQLDRIIDITEGMNTPEWNRQRGLRQVWESNIWITTSGMFSLAPMTCLLKVTSPDKIMLSVDYPFSANEKGKQFIDDLWNSGLVSGRDVEGIAYRNAEALLKIRTGEDNGYSNLAHKRALGEGVNDNSLRKKRGRPPKDSDMPPSEPGAQVPISPVESEAAARRMEKRRCQYCQRIFSRIEHRVRHEKTTHMGEKPFQCQYCSKAFSRSDNFHQHLRTVHSSETASTNQQNGDNNTGSNSNDGNSTNDQSGTVFDQSDTATSFFEGLQTQLQT
ncbi:Decarboxylase orsB [Lasiodiplodia hormozganensis]|uniref:Decarboxylase orsB n=2 Tax=Lasiodiplodia TaxID=66739 RepID=A0A5N5DKE9_9PEZI|nr:Decarboxylase orsB [Lasiodiplodia theobromae]KAK0659994.1 Decarboxylase orsB [Lasiodiplodia hormozganensis]